MSAENPLRSPKENSSKQTICVKTKAIDEAKNSHKHLRTLREGCANIRVHLHTLREGYAYICVKKPRLKTKPKTLINICVYLCASVEICGKKTKMKNEAKNFQEYLRLSAFICGL